MSDCSWSPEGAWVVDVGGTIGANVIASASAADDEPGC